MTKYAYNTIDMSIITGNEDLTYVYDLIDPEHFLAIDNISTWAVNSGISYARPDDLHPSTTHHKEFVNTFIVPHLKTKNYIFYIQVMIGKNQQYNIGKLFYNSLFKE